jgi:hypothetical protein
MTVVQVRRFYTPEHNAWWEGIIHLPVCKVQNIRTHSVYGLLPSYVFKFNTLRLGDRFLPYLRVACSTARCRCMIIIYSVIKHELE